MVIVLTLLNKTNYGPRQISVRGENFALGGIVAIFKEFAILVGRDVLRKFIYVST